MTQGSELQRPADEGKTVMYRPAPEGGLEPAPSERTDYREGLRSRRWNAAPLENPEAEKTDPRIALLTTMPGVGVYTATVIVAEIGDVTRFTGPKQLCSFAGLVPSTRSSGAHIRHGRITKEGSPWLRWVMSWLLRRDPLPVFAWPSITTAICSVLARRLLAWHWPPEPSSSPSRCGFSAVSPRGEPCRSSMTWS